MNGSIYQLCLLSTLSKSKLFAYASTAAMNLTTAVSNHILRSYLLKDFSKGHIGRLAAQLKNWVESCSTVGLLCPIAYTPYGESLTISELLRHLLADFVVCAPIISLVSVLLQRKYLVKGLQKGELKESGRSQRSKADLLTSEECYAAEQNNSKQIVGYAGTLTDTEMIKQSEQAAEQEEKQVGAHKRPLVNALPDLIMRISRGGVFLEFLASPNFQVLGHPKDWVGKHMSDMLSPAITRQRLAAIEQALRSQEIQIYEQNFSIEDDIQIEEVRVIPYGEDEVLFLVRDISDRKQAETALQLLFQQKQTVCQIVQMIRNSLDLPTIFATATAETAKVYPHLNCSVVQYFADQQLWKVTAKFHQDLTLLGSTDLEVLDIDDHSATKLKQSQIVKINNTRNVEDSSNQPTAQLYLGAWLLIPLAIEGEIWGSFCLSVTHRNFIWEDWLVELAQSVAEQLEVAIQQAQLYQQVAAEKQKLTKSEQRFRGLAANLPGVLIQHILYPDESDDVLYISPSCYDLWKVTAEEILESSEVLWDMVYLEDKPAFKESIRCSALERKPWKHEWRILTPSGCTKWLRANGRPENYENGNIIWNTIVIDVSDRIKIQEQLKHASLHDSLTGLPNRALLTERLALSVRKANRRLDYTFAVLFLDLDNFKVINDSLGHLVGDRLLQRVGTVLSDTIRETDIAARLGGDEFVILLDDLDSEAKAEHIAKRILALLQGSLQVKEHEVFVGTSIGIVIGSPHYKSPDELLQDADLAMYSAKQSGRGHYAIFDPAMRTQALQRLQIENDLRRALKQQEFVLFYQPIINLETQAIRGFEALLRWQHPSRGLLLPAAFIDVAEETGLIRPLSDWVLQTACKQIEKWQYYCDRPLSIDINLSIKQLQHSLLPTLKKTLAAYDIEPRSLGLEITESMLAKNIESTAKLLQEIQDMDVRISIDDFGTGYSSFSYLNQLPVDSLKIDRGFVSPTDIDSRHQPIAQAITALGKLLKLEIVAEGIETKEQLEWLRSLGCTYGQGYLFAPPLTAEKAAQLLREQATNGLNPAQTAS